MHLPGRKKRLLRPSLDASPAPPNTGYTNFLKGLLSDQIQAFPPPVRPPTDCSNNPYILGGVFTVQHESRALQDSEQRLSVLLQSLEQVVWFANMDGQMLYINEAAERIYGRPVAEFYDNPTIWLEAVDPRDRQAAEKSIADLAETGTAEAEYRIVRPDGQLIWLHDRKYLVPHKSGAPQSICGIASDVTARRELQEKEAQLEHVARLTSMGEMLASIAHEINQPLAAISNYSTASSNLLANFEAGDTAKLKEWNEAIVNQTTRCSAIIRGLRDFSKQGQGEAILLDVDEVIRESVSLILADARFHAVNIQSDLQSHQGLTRGNRTQLQQVFVNLLRNACEAVATCNQTLRLVTIRSQIAGDNVEVVVKDNGPGIDTQIRDALFEPFVSSREDGLGIGLVISRSIAEKHGGQLWVTPDVADGAEFCLTIPLAPEST
ncbi:MAG TPA: hypothetical protein DCY79_21535 [Planctomycetaceae bacterium]|nr:hypothetical protein [Blastopirellula sp.]HAY82399.1 hypothetical protein [Planctomycetaceae bacterium]